MSLRLVKDVAGEKLVPVVEIMRTTTTIQACIRDGRLSEIEKHIENGRSEYYMQTMDQHLVELCEKKIITVDVITSYSIHYTKLYEIIESDLDFLSLGFKMSL